MKKMSKRILCIILAIIVFVTGLQLPVLEATASEDEWTYITLHSGAVNSYVAYGNENFVRVTQKGTVHISQNGYTWKKKDTISIESNITGLEYCGDYFFGYGVDGEVYLSEDGSSWSTITIGQGCVSKIIYAEGKYVANVGLRNIISGDNIEYIGFGTYESENGIEWEFAESTVNYKFLDMAYGNSCYVAVGVNGVICTKKTGEYWKKQESGIYTTIVSVEYGNGIFIAIDEYGCEYISKDGISWENYGFVGYGKLAYYNARFLFVSETTVDVKECNSNGIQQWQTTYLEEKCGGIRDITCGKGMLVLATQKGVIVCEDANSPDIALDQLRIKQGSLNPDFQSEKSTYNVKVSDELSEIELLAKATEEQAIITIQKENESAKEMLNGGSIMLELGEEDTLFEIIVTSEDGVSEKIYYLTVSKSPQYKITVEPSEYGYVVGAGYVEKDGEITLTAVAKDGFKFLCWMENGKEIGKNEELTLTNIQSDRSICPVFSLLSDNQMSATTKESTATLGQEIVLTAVFEDESISEDRCVWELLNGTDSVVKQILNEDYEQEFHLFVGESEKENPLYVKAYDYYNPEVFCIMTVTIDKEQETEYKITAKSDNLEAGSVNGGGSITSNENMVLTATPKAGYYFVEWQENGVTYSTEETIILSKVQTDLSFTAIFEKIQLESIQIIRKPTKLSYNVGELFETKGMLLQAAYNDGSKKFIANYEYTPKEALTIENSHVSFSYKEGDIIKETVLLITVTDPDASDEDNDDDVEDPKDDDEIEDSKDDDEAEDPKDDDETEDSKDDDENEDPKDDDETEDSKDDDENEDPKDDDETEESKDDTETEDSKDDDNIDDSKNDDKTKDSKDDGTEDSKNHETDKNNTSGENPVNGNQGQNPSSNSQGQSSVTKKETAVTTNTIKAGSIVKSGNYKYKVTKIEKNGTGRVCFIGISKKQTTVKIPASIKINGKKFKVTAIAKNALKNQKKLKNVVIGSYVQTIGTKAFYGCKNLKVINIKTKYLKKVDKKAFYGIKKEAVIYVPKKKYSKYKKLLKGKGQKSSVKIKKK